MLPDPDLSPSQCLNALEANLKTLLLHVGSALSTPAHFDATHITLTKHRVRKALPTTLDNFHRALADLELGLIRASSALHRDFEALRQQSAQNTASVTAESKSESRASPAATKTDADSAMLELQQSAILSDVFGPPTPPQNDGSVTNPHGNATDTSNAPPAFTQPPADDPLAHPKPNGHSLVENTNKAQDTAASVHEQLNTKSDSGSISKQLDSSTLSEAGTKRDAEMANDQVTSASVEGPIAQQNNETTMKSREMENQPSPSKSLNENASNLHPDLELYANDDANTANDDFTIEDFASSNAIATNAFTDTANGEQSQSHDFMTDLPDDFLQDGSGDGMSYEEQFDFGTFDFGGGGEDADDEPNATNRENQSWDSNMFDESLFDLDGGEGD